MSSPGLRSDNEILSDIHFRRIENLCIGARMNYEKSRFEEALDQANTAYLLGREEMLELIVKCNLVLWRPPVLYQITTMIIESTIVTVVKPPPKIDQALELLISQILKSRAASDFANPCTKKDLQKVLLKIHPDRCQHPKAHAATVIVNKYCENLGTAKVAKTEQPATPANWDDFSRREWWRQPEAKAEQPKREKPSRPKTKFRAANDDSDDETTSYAYRRS